MGQKFRNNFSSTLTASILATSTEISLVAVPSPAITLAETDDFFLLTLIDQSGNREIVRCVGLSGLTATIGVDLGIPSVAGRAQEDTTAIPIVYTDNHVVSLRVTKKTLEDIFAQMEESNITLATSGEAATGANDTKYLSPLKGRSMMDGYAPISTQVQAEGMTNNVARCTPLSLKYATDIATAALFPIGTKVLFSQNTVPSSKWSFVADDNDRVLMNTSTLSEGGDVGGDWIISGISVDGHQLSEAEMPIHKHGIDVRWNDTGSGGTVRNSDWAGTNKDTETKAAGGDQEHNHNLTIGSSWRPAYKKVVTFERV